jgi:DNA polymerase-3 subunit chi
MTTKTEVVFYGTPTAQAKRARVCNATYEQYVLGKKVLVRAPNEVAAKYLDDLLWEVPVERFLPHSVTDESTDERIVITTADRNINDADVLLNLAAEPSPMASRFKLVIELYDTTSAAKKNQSEHRAEAYRRKGLEVSSQ